MTELTDQNEEVQPRRFRRYPEYRNSGVEWLGQVPAHWSVKRLKFLAPARISKLDTKPDDAVYVGLEHVESWTGRLLLEPQPPSVDSAVSSFAAGDVLFGKLRPYLAKVARPVFDGVCTSEILPLRPTSGCIQSYMMYCLLNAPYVRWLDSLTYGAKMPRVNPDQVGNSRAPLPPESEQLAIATFLDRETAEIDSLIAKKERLIELLQEKRTALITRAVTRGLAPNVRMKDSGVEWLGEIPAHWEVRRIAMAVNKITNGYVGPTRDILVDDGVPYLQSLHIKNGQIEFDRKHYFVTKYWSDQHRKSILLEGDVLVVQTGDIGQNCVVPAAFEGTNCHALIILRLKPHFGEGAFLSYLLQSSYGQNALKWSQTGALHPHLECGHLREIPIVLPPPEEQSRIVRAVEEQTKALDSLQSKVHSAVDHLKELRTALISAAVTGKIDVREEAA